MYALIDSHCHLDFDAFGPDRDLVIQRARSKGVEHIVIPGVNRNNWGRIRDICEKDARIHACYGLHPYMADEHDQKDITHLKNWLETFAYRVDMDWLVFGFASLLAFLVALLTVSYQAIRAAAANPVKSLRYQ